MQSPKRLTAFVLMTALGTSMMATPAEAKTFPDVPKDHWAYEVVDQVSDDGIMIGYGGTGYFGPSNNLLRAELAGVLQRLSNDKTSGTKDTTGLPDMKNGNMWYTACSNWAFANDLIVGVQTGDKTIFAPMAPVTREQVACILQRYAKMQGADGKAYNNIARSSFTDWNQVSNWAEDGIEWAYERNLLDGYKVADGKGYTLDPKRPVTRAEMAKLIARLGIVIKNGMLNIDIDGDGKADINIDTDGDGKADLNIDTNGDGKPDLNIDKDGDGKADLNIDKDGDGKADLNIDTNGDGKADLNIDTNGDGKADLNIDKDGDGKPDKNIDADGDGKPDKKPGGNGGGGIVVPTPDATVTLSTPEIVYANTAFNIGCKTTDAKDITWAFVHDGKTYTEKELVEAGGDLNLNGGVMKFPETGEWKIVATVTGNNGREVVADKTIQVYAVSGVAFTLPATTHTDTSVIVQTTLTNASDIKWTASKDGQEIALEDAFDGNLTASGGVITFKEQGDYVLTATVVDGAGKTQTCTQSIKVYPVITMDLDVDQYTHIGDDTVVTLKTENAEGKTVAWTVKKGVEGTTVTDEMTGTLGNDGGTVAFNQAGTYTFEASIVDETGREYKVSAPVSCYPVGEVGIALPDWVHEDQSFDVQANFENLGDAQPTWTAKLDGQDVSVSDVLDGTLGVEGGSVTPKQSGQLELTASFTDATGTQYSDTKTMKIYPVPKVSYEMPEDAWTDTEIPLEVTTEKLGNNTIEWLVDNTYGFQDWATFVDGTLNNAGGTIRFKHAGTYRIIARVTDGTGRVFLFDKGKDKTIVQPKLDLTFDLPDALYVGDQCKVRTKGQNNFLPVHWTLKKDNQEVQLTDYVVGGLNELGGDISFNAAGTYELTATMEDVNGRSFTYSDTVVVHPNVKYDLTVDGNDGTSKKVRKHLGESFTIDVDAEHTTGASVTWSVYSGDQKLEWDQVIDGSLTDKSGSISFKGAKGDYQLRADVTDAYGKTTQHTINVTAYNEAPAAPTVNTTIDYKDNQEAFTTNAKVKGSIKLSAEDPWEADEVVSYEWDTTQELQAESGYYTLGTHTGRVRAVDQWGEKSEWTNVSLDVNLAQPSAPTVKATVDYKDLQNKFTADAKAKVSFEAENTADADLTKIVETQAAEYYIVGKHQATATVMDIFGRTVNGTSQFEVSNKAPQVPTLETAVDYNDAQNPYSKEAKVKVTASAVAGKDDRDETRLEWASDSATNDQGAYLGQGTHIAKVRTVDALGGVSDWKTAEINLGVEGKADPAGTVYTKPIINLSSSTLGDASSTERTTIAFAAQTTTSTPTQVKLADYYDSSVRENKNADKGNKTTSFSLNLASSTAERHLVVGQNKDMFGAAVYASKFFIVGSSTSGGKNEITAQTTTTTVDGIYDGDTPLAYIESFVYDIPAIANHNSSGSDYVIAYGITKDGAKEQLLKVNSSSGQTHIDSKKGTYSSDSSGSHSFNFPQNKYTELEFVYYNDHPSCLANATEGLTFSANFKFIEDPSLQENFENLFK